MISRNNTETAFLTSYILNIGVSTAIGTITPMFNPTIVTFGKNVECVDINITMKCTANQAYPTVTSGTAFGTFVFMFKIYGIPKKDNNIILNGSRM